MKSHLSHREIEVLDLISRGLTTKEIASNLFISGHTVISHRKNLMTKMNAPNTAGLVRRAFEYGIIQLNLITSKDIKYLHQ